MNKNKHILFSIALLFVSSRIALASFEDYAGGARMRSMAGAYCAIANDSDSVFIQPAGIMGINNPELSLSYGKLFMGLTDESKISDNQASLGIPLFGYSALGFGYKSLNLDSMYKEETVIANTAFSGGKNLDFGFSIKFLSVKYGSDSYTAIDPVFRNVSSKKASDFDFGFIYRPFPKLNIAYVKANITGADIGISEKAPVSSRDHIGISYMEDSFTIMLETVMKDGGTEFIAGTEKGLIKDMIHLRAGINSLNGSFGKFTAGFGLSFKDFNLSYAWNQVLRGIENTSGTHYITFSAPISGKDRETSEDSEESVAVKAGEAMGTKSQILEEEDVILKPSLTEAVEKNEEIKASYDEDLRNEYMKRILGEEKAGEIILKEEQVSTEPSESPEELIDEKLDKKGILKFIGTKDILKNRGLREVKPDTVKEEVFPLIAVPSVEPAEKVKGQKVKDSPEVNEVKERRMPKPAAKTHKVKDGETLPGLALKYYNDRSMWIKIYEANKEKTEKGALKPGTVLIIP